MRLAEDRRARVPFALVGVLLLVGSTTFAATLSTRGPLREDRSVETAMDRATAGANTALRSATDDAARGAARNPVTAPANTPFGRVLNDSTPFRDSLRVRIYLAARERFRTADYHHRGVVAAASLPSTPNVSTLRAAKRRVRIRGVDNGTALRVTVRNVSVTARRDGRVVARERTTMRLRVATPVLAMHDRTRRFERRLNRGPLDGPGLGRRLSFRLYPVVWARGAAQYGGLPVENVLANRHVELSTNGAVLAEQREAFGRTDAEGRRGFRRALLRVGAQDLLAAAPGDQSPLVRPKGPGGEFDGPIPRRIGAGDAPEPERNVTVGVNGTADRAFVALLDGGPGADAADARTFDDVLRRSYRGEARIVTGVEQVESGTNPDADAPGRNWTLVDADTTRRTTVEPTARAPEPSVGGDGRVFERYRRHVTIRHAVERTWRRGRRETTTSDARVDRYRVGVALVGTFRPEVSAPERPVSPLFERGGALDGPNLREVPGAARSLLSAEGGPDGVARKAVSGHFDARREVDGVRSDELRSWAYADVAALRERVRNVSVRVEAGTVAAGRANPPAELAAELRARRTELVDPPERYDGVAGRARVAVRAAYLDRVIAKLERRAGRTRRANGNLTRRLRKAGFGSSRDVMEVMQTRRDVPTPRRRAVDDGTAGGRDAFVPEASPGYLPLSSVDADRLAGVRSGRYHPLVAENVNAFTFPSGDAANAVTGQLFGDLETVRLRTAARTLVAANRTLAANPDPDLRRDRNELRAAVATSLRGVSDRTAAALGTRVALSREQRRRVVDAAVARWNGTGRQALAATNGSLASAVVAETAARPRTDLSRQQRDRLEVRIRVALGEAVRADAGVPTSTTNETVVATRTVAEREMNDALGTAFERAGNETFRAAQEELVERGYLDETIAALPTGMPVAPVPGYWYATVNLWDVTVRGEYPRFAVRARRGAPGSGGTVRYVRDGTTVALDVDGDGDPERLGRNERVSFTTGTVVPIAVPPGKGGVGDKDGVMFERSPGWSSTGCADWCLSAANGSASADAKPPLGE